VAVLTEGDDALDRERLPPTAAVKSVSTAKEVIASVPSDAPAVAASRHPASEAAARPAVVASSDRRV